MKVKQSDIVGSIVLAVFLTFVAAIVLEGVQSRRGSRMWSAVVLWVVAGAVGIAGGAIALLSVSGRSWTFSEADNMKAEFLKRADEALGDTPEEQPGEPDDRVKGDPGI